MKTGTELSAGGGDTRFIGGIVTIVEEARRYSARSINSILTAAYWEIGRRLVEFEQKGKKRAGYGTEIIRRLSGRLTARFGRGFSERNLEQMRQFYLIYPRQEIRRTLSGKLSPDAGPIPQTLSAESTFQDFAGAFPLSWSHYVLLLSVKRDTARKFYETESLRGGWSVRQLERQIDSQFYERTLLSRNKAAMLTKGAQQRQVDMVTPEEEIKSPYVLEFLGLKDEYSETELEETLIRHLESFLLELGGEFTFVARQKRLRVGDEWYRVDLVFYHRRLQCLVLIDLKIGKYTHADAGQMHLYLNYAREHWMVSEENPPVGLILCARKDESVARYTLNNLPNKVLAAEYMTVLPGEKILEEEIQKTRRLLAHQGTVKNRN
jgi:predicted nuclease of restriction endonuclease-like (RecB) superfamily